VSDEFVTMEQEMAKKDMKPEDARESPIGLGYRVPLVIASPWTRGGWVNSQVFDHTSTLQFLEKFLAGKTKRKPTETNISQWRRTVCGDLTSAFRPYNGEKIALPAYIDKLSFVESIHKAQFKQVPSGFKQLSFTDIAAINKDPLSSPLMAQQEKGISPACALPYELSVNGRFAAKEDMFVIKFGAGKTIFGAQSAGAPFTVYGPDSRVWHYAVKAGDAITDSWEFNPGYNLKVYGPNGFYREFRGSKHDPEMDIVCTPKANGNIEIQATGDKSYNVEIITNAYKTISQKIELISGKARLMLDLSDSFGWYDFSIKVKGYENYEQRFAGRVETGKSSFTDPLMGRVL
jgi:phospholipase C